MKKRTVLCFALAALLIVFAFVGPPIVLRAAVGSSLRTPKQLDASLYAITSDADTVGKLSALSNPSALSFHLDPEETRETITSDLQDELASLAELGAIRKELYGFVKEAANDECTIDRLCIVQPSTRLVFEVYNIQLWMANANIIMDASTGKVLQLSFHPTEAGFMNLEFGDTHGPEELDGWAAYLGLEAGNYAYSILSLDVIARLDNTTGRYRDAVLKEARLRDSSGASVVFGLRYEFTGGLNESYCWGVVDSR